MSREAAAPKVTRPLGWGDCKKLENVSPEGGFPPEKPVPLTEPLDNHTFVQVMSDETKRSVARIMIVLIIGDFNKCLNDLEKSSSDASRYSTPQAKT